jgi:cytohesin
MSEAAETLPPHPNLDWYKKSAKKRLDELRATNPSARLANAQLAIAREHGFPSWRKLKERIDQATDLPKLFDSIRRHETAAIRDLLRQKPGLSRLADDEGQTAIHIAAESNNPDAIVLLLESKADPKVYYGRSAHNALSWSLTTGAFDSANALVRNGIEPDFFCAAGMGDVDRVRSFFDSNGKLIANASHTGSSRWSPDGTRMPAPPATARERISDALYFASRNGYAPVVRELLAHDPDLSFRAFLGGTALHWAYYSGQREVVEILLRAGADPTLRDHEFNCTPRAFGICVASSWGIAPIFRRVIQMDPSVVNIFEGRGTPLHESARAGNARFVEALLRAGADPSIRDADGKTPLDYAREVKCDAAMDILQSSRKEN